MRRLAGATLALLTLAGCQTTAEAGSPADPARLINTLASRLAEGAERTYTAEYRLAGNEIVTVVQGQKPLRTAYTHPGGKLIITPEGANQCGTQCSAIKPTPATGVPVAIPGFLTGPQAIRVLTESSLHASGTITPSDTTLAGQHALCVKVDRYEACFTDRGVLGSFTGEVGGVKVDVVLSRYEETVAANAFDKPAGQ
ncbi:hypothetical protein [Longispora albida]|uniref:hypothetical protein n=1 Tax=Longispora albida TaxID=203523 RepID=UPI00035F1F84|nr:hypothetical protein [Longispora albida]